MSPSPLPPPLPIKPSEREPDYTDIDLLIRLWNAGPASKDVALEMADRNRVNARSERK